MYAHIHTHVNAHTYTHWFDWLQSVSMWKVSCDSTELPPPGKQGQSSAKCDTSLVERLLKDKTKWFLGGGKKGVFSARQEHVSWCVSVLRFPMHTEVETLNDSELNLYFTPKWKLCHHLLNRVTFFLQWNTKGTYLKNIMANLLNKDKQHTHTFKSIIKVAHMTCYCIFQVFWK